MFVEWYYWSNVVFCHQCLAALVLWLTAVMLTNSELRTDASSLNHLLGGVSSFEVYPVRHRHFSNNRQQHR